jgi:triacylglycerol lipase
MVKELNSGPGGAAVPGVTYTTIPTIHDELVVPYTSGILHAPNVTNEVLRDVCPDDLSEHAAEALDPVVAQLVLNALDPANAKPVSCGAPTAWVAAALGRATRQARARRGPAPVPAAFAACASPDARARSRTGSGTRA